ncbi:ethylbenzene dehydrogenase-related protein [Alcanivorax sp.]|jgi:hypothetical protein|uniref:ethylbenzene dehydrogenase-related protein n=1 Tax=Alcanivorax sp. TaxID=1872427 RepID=UPI0032D8F1CC
MEKNLRTGRSKLPVFILHTLVIVCLAGAFLTGMRIASASEPQSWAAAISASLPQGNVYRWHSYLGAGILFITVAYVIFIAVSGHYRRLQRRPKQSRWSRENLVRQIIALGLVLVVLSVATGLWLYLGDPGQYRSVVLTIHHVSAWSFVVYTVVHLLSVLLAGGMRRLLAIFLPRFTQPGLTTTTCLAALAVASWLYASGNRAGMELLIHYTQTPVALDGEARETAWAGIAPVTVHTFKGRNQGDDGIPVEIRALHDSLYAYFLFSWADPTRSLTHLPLEKTEDGWKVIQTEARTANENVFYEDKFAVMLSRSSEMAGAGTVHLGKGPLSRHPDSAGGRGLHYSTDGTYVDVWHWKAVRTGLSLGQADDNHFGPALPSQSEYKRYTAGYQKDPDCEHLVRWEANDYQLKPECGGYIMNWTLYDDGIIQPRRLPRDIRQLQSLSQMDRNASTSDEGQWWMDWNDTVRYNAEIDTLPVGTVIPSVLSLGPFTQGRGGVDAGARWADGRWTLEIRRRLQVNNKYDLPIEDGMHLWVAPFNHSQTGHAYHLHPLRLSLEPAPNE